MLKVVIKNKLGEVTHSGLFNSQEDSQAWVASQLAKGINVHGGSQSVGSLRVKLKLKGKMLIILLK